MLAFSRLAPKEVLLMPVSRREIWLARWVAATLMTSLWALAAQSVGVGLVWLGRGGPPDVAGLALTSTCVFAYTGALMSLLPVVDLARQVPLLRRVKGLLLALHVGVIALFGGGVIWPALVYARLPAAWGDVSDGFGIALLVGVALAVAGLRYRPAIRAHAVSLASAPPASHASRWAPVLDDRFTGLPKLLWLDVTRAGAGLAFMFVTIIGISVATDAVMGVTRGVSASLSWLGTLPFDVGLGGGIVALFAGTISMTIRDLDFGLQRTDLLRGSLRHWRTLPLSSSAVAGLLIARRLLGWPILWSMLLVLQLSFVGAPASLRLDLLAFVAGLDALAFASGLRWRMRTSTSDHLAMVFVLSLLIALIGRKTGGPDALVLYATGAVSLGLAALIHRSSLASSATYLPVIAGGRGVSGDIASST
jgi:hypothetical protein